MNETWAQVTVRVFTLRPCDEITQLLGIAPTNCVAEMSHGRESGRVLWTWDTPLPSNAQLESHLTHMVQVFTSRKDVLRELAKEGPVDLFVGFGADSGQAGVSLTPELLGDLASIPWTVHLDLYPPPPSVSPRIVSGPAATEE